MNPAEAVQTVATLRAYWPNPEMTPEVVDAWLEVFETLDAGAVHKTLRRMFTSEARPFRPMPAEVTDSANGGSGANADWAAVVQLVRSRGRSALADERAAAYSRRSKLAIDNLGGWYRFCEMDASQQEREFRRAHAAVAPMADAEVEAALKELTVSSVERAPIASGARPIALGTGEPARVVDHERGLAQLRAARDHYRGAHRDEQPPQAEAV